jgi:hypothetical protein
VGGTPSASGTPTCVALQARVAWQSTSGASKRRKATRKLSWKRRSGVKFDHGGGWELPLADTLGRLDDYLQGAATSLDWREQATVRQPQQGLDRFWRASRGDRGGLGGDPAERYCGPLQRLHGGCPLLNRSLTGSPAIEQGVLRSIEVEQGVLCSIEVEQGVLCSIEVEQGVLCPIQVARYVHAEFAALLRAILESSKTHTIHGVPPSFCSHSFSTCLFSRNRHMN